MRTPGDLERLTAGEGQRALGSTALCSALAVPPLSRHFLLKDTQEL